MGKKFYLIIAVLLVVKVGLAQLPQTIFNVNATQGLTTDTFTFTDASLNTPTNYTWVFSPTNVLYLNGTNANSKNPMVRLTNPATYTVKLITANTQGTDTLTKLNYIQTYTYSAPYSIQNISSADGSIGVSRVKLSTIDTTLNPYSPVYTLVQGNQKTTLFRGKKNGLLITRPANTTAASYKAWIDFNRNGNFENNELVLDIANSNNATIIDSFFIPNNQAINYTFMRVGVALAAGTFNASVATIGIYRDFRINIGNDFIRPTITLNSSATLYSEVGKSFFDPMATAIDNHEDNISHKVQRIGNVDTSTVGNYILKYFVKDFYDNYSDTITRQVLITQSQTAPTLTLIGDSIVTMQVHTKYIEPGYTAFDNTNNNITSFVVVSGNLDTTTSGFYTLYYTVSDAFNRTTVKYRTVKVIDTQKPVIVPKFANPYKHLVYTNIDLYSLVTVNDNSLKTITPLVYGNVNTTQLGLYNIMYKAYDWSGNAADSIIVVVQVADTLKPRANDTSVFRPIEIEVFSIFTDPNVSYSDNYTPPELLVKLATGFVNTAILGTYERIYTCTDQSNNSISYKKLIKVVDTTKPKITLLGANPINHEINTAFVEPGYLLSDNYDKEADLTLAIEASVLKDSLGRYIFVKPGLENIKYTCTDLSNNSITVTRIINVITVGLTEFNNINNLLQIYPNPVSSYLLLEPTKQFKQGEIGIYNLLGKQIGEQSTITFGSTQKIYISHLPNGIYLLKLNTNNQTYMHKFIVQH